MATPGQKHVVSNLASQQNFLRTLTGLSRLTGDERYAQATKEAVAYMFEHCRAPCGLLYWGGHTFIDLKTLDVVPIEVQSMKHIEQEDSMMQGSRFTPKEIHKETLT